jgi:hypothetical protein
MGVSGWKEERFTVEEKTIASSVSADGKTKLIFLRLPDGGCIGVNQVPSGLWRVSGVGRRRLLSMALTDTIVRA